jgi:monodechloroaminopyrrolnitrin synthase
MRHAALPSIAHDFLGKVEQIQNLDPLNFDGVMPVLHALNRQKDTHEIIQLMYRHLPVPERLDLFGFEESIAAMRDLGIFIGILKKHGIEPVDVVPELEYVLLVLMVKTGLPPRDTLIHYTAWNPDGERMRTYTGLEDEKYLIESVKVAYPGLLEAILLLERAYCITHDVKEFISHCHAARQLLEGMVNGVVIARRKVSPAVFANELRFYYDAIKVDYNNQYMGPGAVEMPMFVVDHILWSCDCIDKVYSDFKEGFLPYNLKPIREVYHRFTNRPSLVTLVNLMYAQDPSEENFHAAMAVSELLTILKSFRMPHKKLAESAYQHQDENHHQKGSGGYATDILSHIIHLQQLKTSTFMETLLVARQQRIVIGK